MTHHIKEFTVHDYKGIHELTLKDIAPINILTGDNNSGKTSMLELLATIPQPQQLRNWLPATRMISSRYAGYYRYSTFFESFLNLFPCNQDAKSICYEWFLYTGEKHSAKITGVVFQDQIPESELRRINGYTNNRRQISLFEDFIIVQGLKLLLSKDEEQDIEETIWDRQGRIPPSSRTSQRNPVVLITPVEHEGYIRFLNDVLQHPQTYNLLIEMLKFFDKDIFGLNAVENNETHTVSYLIQSSRHDQSLSLSSYGDGMKKAVLLLSALLQAKNGILLIDEFETGIHTSCMDQVFTLLLENALKLNIQVFLTSHSKEAISKVLRLSPSIQEKIALYTLYKYEGKNYVRRVGCQEAIKMQDELGMELR